MYKIIILALREYKTSVRTKSFIIGLVIAPILMGGGFIAMALMGNNVDVGDKTICVIDHTHQLSPAIIDAANYHNEHEIFDTIKNKQTKPRYIIEVVEPDTVNPFVQKLQLSEQVRNKQKHAFIEIGADVINPKGDADKTKIKYYSENSIMDDIRYWFNNPINNKIRQIRISQMGMNENEIQQLFHWIDVSGMGLISAEDEAGGQKDATETNMIETIAIPYIFMLLMFMMVLMSAVPLLNSVMEEKTERIAEVILGTVTPFQFMMGKVLGSISVSLTGSAVYVIGGIITVGKFGYGQYVPYDLLPWFFAYMLLSILMIGSIMASLGSACNDSKDAQSLQFPAMLPIIIPMFVMMPVLKDPLSNFSTGMSLFPPFTPFLMLVRQASPVTIPAWQPIVGICGVVLFTIFSVWAGSKIFRTLILVQGKKPSLGTLLKYIVKK